ncbi:MAG: hypothetical protein IPJ65_01520 [Archangiaceae bacterium]|nr:hypothetical protein [Archangiaceae bacterium]
MTTIVRDHRSQSTTAPVVRDHRTESASRPVVRDHRTESTSGPVVRDHRTGFEPNASRPMAWPAHHHHHHHHVSNRTMDIFRQLLAGGKVTVDLSTLQQLRDLASHGGGSVQAGGSLPYPSHGVVRPPPGVSYPNVPAFPSRMDQLPASYYGNGTAATGAAATMGAGFRPTGDTTADLTNAITNAPTYSPTEQALLDKIKDPEQRAMQELQMQMQKQSLLCTVLSNLANMRHEMKKAVAQNLRG